MMSKRLLTAAVAIPLLILLLLLGPAWLVGLAVGLISACCCWEFLGCTEKELSLPIRVCALLAAFAIPFCGTLFDYGRVATLALFGLFAVLFGDLMLSFRRETTMDFETVTVALLGGAAIPTLLGCLGQTALLEQGRVLSLIPFIVAFVSDGAAYFVGGAIGRHALTPRLSPHKTLEGSAAGFVAAIALLLAYGLILKAGGFAVNFAVLGAYGFLGSLASQLGDLSFSAVKRLYGNKDFGGILPGHGGMLDRFDSMVWAAPLLYYLCLWVPAVSK